MLRTASDSLRSCRLHSITDGMSKLSLISCLVILLAGSVLSACTMGLTEGPVPAATLSDEELTALVADLPTLPATYTPSATWSPVPDTGEAAEPSTETPTRTPIWERFSTPTVRPTRTPTPTWTPDVRQLPPTRIPGTGPTLLPTRPFGTATTLPSGCVARPNAQNLMRNGSFEGGTYDQGMPGQVIPENWLAFWRGEETPVTHDPSNQEGHRRPEFLVISKVPPYDNPPRIMDGSKALFLAASGRVIDGGVQQDVAVNMSDVLCLTGYAHGWSNNESDDIFHSQLVTEDDRNNLTFQLGIDPTGGNNPWASTVVWGPTIHTYDIYQSIPSLQVVAQQNSVTVFVRGSTLWRFRHNNLYFDDIRLERIQIPSP